jgi:hypothetical protein
MCGGLGFDSRQEQRFFTLPPNPDESHAVFLTISTDVFYSGVKRPGCEANHSPPYRAEVNPLKAETHLDNTYKFSPYRKENTTLHHFKDQLVDAD